MAKHNSSLCQNRSDEFAVEALIVYLDKKYKLTALSSLRVVALSLRREKYVTTRRLYRTGNTIMSRHYMADHFLERCSVSNNGKTNPVTDLLSRISGPIYFFLGFPSAISIDPGIFRTLWVPCKHYYPHLRSYAHIRAAPVRSGYTAVAEVPDRGKT